MIVQNNDQPWTTNFQVEITKKHLDLQTFQQLWSLTRIYLRKMCVHFSERLLLKCNENTVFFFKIKLARVINLKLVFTDNFFIIW